MKMNDRGGLVGPTRSEQKSRGGGGGRNKIMKSLHMHLSMESRAS